MKTARPDGDLAAESLYCFDERVETVKNVVNPSKNTKAFFGRPSIIPGVPYPLSGREQQIIRYTWRHAEYLAQRGLL